MKSSIKTFIYGLSGALLFLISGADGVFASDVSDVSDNILSSVDNTPGLISAIAYIIAIVFAATGLLKLKDHVEAPNQVPLKEAVTRFLAGGALFALPSITIAMRNTIDTGVTSGDLTFGNALSDIAGELGGLFDILALGQSFNGLLENIGASLNTVPDLLSGLSYLAGLVLAVWGILNLKSYIENPQGNVQIREPVIRLLTGGALFALPTVFVAMQQTISAGNPDGSFNFASFFSMFGIAAGGVQCGADVFLNNALFDLLGLAPGDTLRTVICNIMMHTTSFPEFLHWISYLIGLFLGIWGLLKIKDHVLNPAQNPLWDGIARLLAGGALFSLPYVIEVIRNTLLNDWNIFGGNTGFNNQNVSDGGLDARLVGFMDLIFNPMVTLFMWFGYIAGIILIILGIMRLLKSTQEGPRGPAGIGTIITFLVGGLLLSFSPIIGTLSASLFGDSTTTTFASIQFDDGMDPDAINHTNAVISAALQLMIILGMVSVLRGFFILRSVAEGSQQASIMASMTHIIGGAMAINLGPLLNVMQDSLGLGQFGVQFM